jgi:pilus assembly protein Flp/PilA
MAVLLRFLRDESGTTAMEYAFIAGIVSVGLIISFNAIGSKLNVKFIPVSNGLN